MGTGFLEAIVTDGYLLGSLSDGAAWTDPGLGRRILHLLLAASADGLLGNLCKRSPI